MRSFRRALKKIARFVCYPFALIVIAAWIILTYIMRELYYFYAEKNAVTFRDFLVVYVLGEF